MTSETTPRAQLAAEVLGVPVGNYGLAEAIRASAANPDQPIYGLPENYDLPEEAVDLIQRRDGNKRLSSIVDPMGEFAVGMTFYETRVGAGATGNRRAITRIDRDGRTGTINLVFHQEGRRATTNVGHSYLRGKLAEGVLAQYPPLYIPRA